MNEMVKYIKNTFKNAGIKISCQERIEWKSKGFIYNISSIHADEPLNCTQIKSLMLGKISVSVVYSEKYDRYYHTFEYAYGVGTFSFYVLPAENPDNVKTLAHNKTF